MFMGYVRVSSDSQEDNTSLAEQERVIRGMAAVKGVNRFDIAIYTDKAVSGAMPLPQRPDGQRLWSEAKSGDFICVAKLDRLFRNARDALTCAEELKKRGVNMIFCDVNIDTSTSTGALFFTVMAAFAAWERDRIFERTRAGIRAIKERGGHYGGAAAAYGLRIENKMLVPVASEQAMVSEVMRMHLKGYSNSRILRRLKRAGIKTRSGHYFKSIEVRRIIASQRWPELGRPAALKLLQAAEQAARIKAFEDGCKGPQIIRRDVHGAEHLQADL